MSEKVLTAVDALNSLHWQKRMWEPKGNEQGNAGIVHYQEADVTYWFEGAGPVEPVNFHGDDESYILIKLSKWPKTYQFTAKMVELVADEDPMSYSSVRESVRLHKFDKYPHFALTQEAVLEKALENVFVFVMEKTPYYLSTAYKTLGWNHIVHLASMKDFHIEEFGDEYDKPKHKPRSPGMFDDYGSSMWDFLDAPY